MRQPDKNRYLNAIRHVESEEVPLFEPEIDTAVAERILGRPLPKVRPFEIPASDYVELNLLAGNDMVFWHNVWELGRKNYIDADGRKHYIDGTIKTAADLKAITFPNLDLIRRGIEELLAALEGTGMGFVFTPWGAPFIVTTAIGYQDYYMYMITNPRFIREFQKRIDDICMQEFQIALSYPIDAVQVGAVLCSNTGFMFSKEMMEEFEFPKLRRSIAMAKARGLPVSTHQDGNVAALFPDFIEMGADVINPIEPCGGAQDIYRLKKKYGHRIALHGNIDLNLLASGTPEQIQADVVEHIDRLAGGGGYVCGSSHNITEAIPVRNFFALRDAVHSHRFRRTASARPDHHGTE